MTDLSARRDYIANAQAQMRKGTLEISILLIIARGEVYASDIIEKLIEADLIIVEGTLYPLLSRLRRSGLLEYHWKESTSGPPRKYYSLTPDGKVALKNLKSTWGKISNSINKLTN